MQILQELQLCVLKATTVITNFGVTIQQRERLQTAGATMLKLRAAVCLLAAACSLHVVRSVAVNQTVNQTVTHNAELYRYLTALENNKTFYYEPVDPAYYAGINNNSIIEFNGTFYEDLNGTFYALQRQANGTFILPSNESGIVESSSADGKYVWSCQQTLLSSP